MGLGGLGAESEDWVVAHIDALIDKVTDPDLRQTLRDQIDIMLNKQSFGLVFQAHKPETVELPYYRVRKGCKVRYRAEPDSPVFEVLRADRTASGSATIATLDEAKTKSDLAIADLVVVREFGEPIYPGLRSVGEIKRGGTKPSHVVINAENFHALETLLYTHEDKVDAIYIDPPYNSGARTWKYNNDYVDAVDQYRHSKWLSFMEKRLNLAKRLLNPQRSVLIVTIDENEVHRLALLLNQVFPTNRVQTVTTVINPKGASLGGDFARVDEYIFFVYIGAAAVQPGIRDMLNDDVKREKPPPVKRETRNPELTDLVLAKTRVVSDAKRWPKHLLAAEDRTFPCDLKGWEAKVMEIELADKDLVGWYRNPTGGAAALRVPFQGTQFSKSMYPDFVFVHRTDDGLRPSIVDPHGFHLADASAKLKGLADYAALHGDDFDRIDAVVEVDDKLLALNLRSEAVRDAVGKLKDGSVKELFETHAGLYS